ncbi:MAG: subclass B1 metallo-beta-lactamase [Gammaproteobacteria bacterium]|nr:subclass B1 metallo-beta-lactamase [Gammaproteobacteria bacterium]
MKLIRKHDHRIVLLILCALVAGGCFKDKGLQITPTLAAETNALPAIEIKQLRPGVWVHTSYHRLSNGTVYPSNGAIVQEGEHLLLIDPAWGAEATQQLLQSIDREIGLPIKRAVSTHFHGDRTLGVDVLAAAGVTVFAHPRTIELSASRGNPVPENVLPNLNLSGAKVSLGSVEVFYPGPGHAPDNIMVWLPQQNILYGGCAIREMASNTLGNTEDADLLSWPESIKQAQQRYTQAEIIIPGHGKIGGAELFGHMLRLFEQSR